MMPGPIVRADKKGARKKMRRTEKDDDDDVDNEDGDRSGRDRCCRTEKHIGFPLEIII